MGKILFLDRVQQGQHKQLDEQHCRCKCTNVQALENYDEVSLEPSGMYNATGVCLCRFGF